MDDDFFDIAVQCGVIDLDIAPGVSFIRNIEILDRLDRLGVQWGGSRDGANGRMTLQKPIF